MPFHLKMNETSHLKVGKYIIKHCSYCYFGNRKVKHDKVTRLKMPANADTVNAIDLLKHQQNSFDHNFMFV